MSNYFKFIHEHKLFSNLTDAQISRLLTLGKIREYKAEEVIIEEGDSAHDLYIIIKGEVEVLKKEEESQKLYPIITLTKGDIFGEMSLLESTRAATVKTTQPTTILSISIDGLHDFANSNAPESEQLIYYKIVERIAHEISHRLRLTNDMVAKVLHQEETGSDAATAHSQLFAGFWQF